jgi:hypothetical protein
MIPVPRLRLKRSTGWFAAGHEMATALPMLSDAAFKLYVYLCLNVKRHNATMAWEPVELAERLQRDSRNVSNSLEELCRREVCIHHHAADRPWVEICDRFWPYEKSPAEESSISQNSYVQRVRQMLIGPACVRINFSSADEQLAATLYRRGITLVQIQHVIWLGCARKYVAMLNSGENAQLLITSLNYFLALVEEVTETSVGEDYWTHMQHKAKQLETMWRARTQRGNTGKETK